MIVSVNGSPRELPACATVANVVELLAVGGGARGVAVAVEGEVVARGAWETTELREGAGVEVLSAIGGG